MPKVNDETSAARIGKTPETEIVETLHSVRECFVDVFKPGGARIRFRVNRRGGRPLTFTDPREQFTGTAGTRGIWGTLPEQPAGRPRSLTPTGFRAEVARLIGAERALEIVRTLKTEEVRPRQYKPRDPHSSSVLIPPSSVLPPRSAP